MKRKGIRVGGFVQRKVKKVDRQGRNYVFSIRLEQVMFARERRIPEEKIEGPGVKNESQGGNTFMSEGRAGRKIPGEGEKKEPVGSPCQAQSRKKGELNDGVKN